MLEALWTALVALFVTVDPLGLVPIFVALTPGLGEAERAALARRAVLLASLVLLLFALAGEAVLAWLGIGMPAFRVAGGLFLGLLEAFSISILPMAYKDVVAILVLLIVLFVKPGGLFGSREAVALKEY